MPRVSAVVAAFLVLAPAANGFAFAPPASKAAAARSISSRGDAFRMSMSTPQQPTTRRGAIKTLCGSSAAVGAAAGAAALFGNVGASVADSTGKFSSKMTANKRYRPRVEETANDFKGLKGLIDQGSWAEAASFFPKAKEQQSAFDLLASSLKRGEYPDKISKEAGAKSTDFFKQLAELEKTVKSKNSAKALAQLSVTQTALDAYLACVAEKKPANAPAV